MENKISIGILAGMGPRSTTPFLELLLDQCQEQYGAKYDIDYPHILIYSLPTPFFIDRETDPIELKKSIKEGLAQLASYDVNLIGIPCNIAHVDFDYITQEINVPVLNMIDETVDQLNENSRVAVLATEMTMRSGLYQEGIERRKCQLIRNEWQWQVNEIIKRIKNKEDQEITRKKWDELLHNIRSTEVDTIIIACTDLNVVIKEAEGIQILDSAKLLAKGLVKGYLNLIKNNGLKIK